MKVIKYISGNTYNNRNDIIDNYFLVDNDYNFGINDTEDVTSFKTLTAFYGVGRFNYKIYRDSLIDNILPDYLLLSNDEKRNLIYNRIFPSGTTNAALISLVGSQKELDTIFNTISEYELVDENKTTILNDLDEKLDITDFNSYTGNTNTKFNQIENDINLLEISLSGNTLETRAFFVGKTTSQSLTTSDVTINSWDAPIVTSNEIFSFNRTTGVFTFIESGLYTITFYATTNTTAGSDRSDSTTNIEIDSGSGYAPLANSRAYYYNRLSDQGKSNGSVTLTNNFTSGTSLRVRGRINSGNDAISVLGGTVGLNIVKEEIGAYNTIFTGETNSFLTNANFFSYSAETESKIEQIELSNVDSGIYAAARTNAAGTLLDGFGLSVVKSGTGTYDYSFGAPVAGSNYVILGQSISTVDDTNFQVSNISSSGFRVTLGVGDNAAKPDVLTDTDHALGIFGVPISGVTGQSVVSSGTFNTTIDLLNDALDNKLDTSTFAVYSGNTNSVINGKLNTSTFANYSGNTNSVINGKLDTSTFANYSGTTQTLINTKANSNSPTLTGTPTTPTATVGTNTQQIASTAFVLANRNIYGTQFQLAQSLGASTSTSTTPITKVTLTTNSLPSGTYKIMANWRFTIDSISDYARFDMTIGGTPVGSRTPIQIESKDTDNIESQTITVYRVLSGVNTILLRYYSSGAPTTISDASIEIIRVS
jgi:hypothetical protein